MISLSVSKPPQIKANLLTSQLQMSLMADDLDGKQFAVKCEIEKVEISPNGVDSATFRTNTYPVIGSGRLGWQSASITIDLGMRKVYVFSDKSEDRNFDDSPDVKTALAKIVKDEEHIVVYELSKEGAKIKSIEGKDYLLNFSEDADTSGSYLVRDRIVRTYRLFEITRLLDRDKGRISHALKRDKVLKYDHGIYDADSVDAWIKTDPFKKKPVEKKPKIGKGQKLKKLPNYAAEKKLKKVQGKELMPRDELVEELGISEMKLGWEGIGLSVMRRFPFDQAYQKLCKLGYSLSRIKFFHDNVEPGSENDPMLGLKVQNQGYYTIEDFQRAARVVYSKAQYMLKSARKKAHGKYSLKSVEHLLITNGIRPPIPCLSTEQIGGLLDDQWDFIKGWLFSYDRLRFASNGIEVESFISLIDKMEKRRQLDPSKVEDIYSSIGYKRKIYGVARHSYEEVKQPKLA